MKVKGLRWMVIGLIMLITIINYLAPEKYSNCGQLFRLPDGLPIAPELLTKWYRQCDLPALAVGW